MELIQFGYDQDPAYHARGIARPDWSLWAQEDSRGFGWQLTDIYGGRSRHMNKEDAIAALTA
jgi:hypothetical protein